LPTIVANPGSGAFFTPWIWIQVDFASKTIRNKKKKCLHPNSP
jgi:hypothetical protein